jgi:mannose-6-phosphate isomerase-like protein (cupin superfamily)
MPARTQSYWVLGHRVTPIETLSDYALLNMVTPVGVPGPPPHYHEDAAELFLVTEGELDVMIDGEWQTLRAGESACVPRGAVHTFRNPGDTDARWVTAFSPRGFERAFVDFGIPVEQAGSVEASVADEVIGRFVAECPRYGMIIAQ